MNSPPGASLWHATLPDDERLAPDRPALAGDTHADVAIVGAGYTGLWTAYALLSADPSLRVVVCERERVGFGASGRNGGWCSSFFAGGRHATAKRHGREGVIAMQRAMFDTVAEIERVVREEKIECDWARGGTVHVATQTAQLRRMRQELADHRAWGFGPDDYRHIPIEEAGALIGCTPNLGVVFTPHCAAIHPAKLAQGLARAVERKGATIHERTAVTEIEPGCVRTTHGNVRADVVVRATEAFTVDLPGLRRAYAPVYTLMIATEPLPREFWAEAHLEPRPTFADYRHMIIYGQRTADDRFAFGGRGAPYHFGSRVQAEFDRRESVFQALGDTLRSLFPQMRDAAITHSWGGAVAVPRDWYPSVGFDRATGIAWAGGYVGDGVSTTNLAGRTIADLVLGRETDVTGLPWVNHVSPQWETEPLRWLGLNTGRALAHSIDRAEDAGRRAPVRTRVFRALLGE